MEGKVICGDVLKAMKKIPDNSVHLAITSPPYNIGKEYEKKLQEEKKKIEQLKEEAKSVGVELGDFDELLGTMNLNQARTISEIFNAKIKEVTYKKEIGELVPVKQVEKEAFEAARMVRDSFLSLPDRVSSVLIGKDKNDIKVILHKEIIQILENLT